MTETKVSETIGAPAAKVWELLGDFGGVARWGGPMLESCTLEGSGVGAVRRIGIRGGLQIAERCEEYDAAGRSLSYSIIEGGNLFSIKNYLSTCSVVETSPTESRVDWSGTFDPDGVSEEQAQATVSRIYTGAIDGVRKALLGT